MIKVFQRDKERVRGWKNKHFPISNDFRNGKFVEFKPNINITHTFMHDLNEFITFNGVIYTHFIETWWNISGYNFCHWKGNTEI